MRAVPLSLTLLSLACMLCTPPMAEAQSRPSKVSSGNARILRAGLKEWPTLRGPDRRRFLVTLSREGVAGRGFISSVLAEDPSSGSPIAVLRALDQLEGRDLSRQLEEVPPSKFAPFVFTDNEVIMVRGLNRWAGLRVTQQNLETGTLDLELYETDEAIKHLGGPGITKSQHVLPGSVVPGDSYRRKAFADRDFVCDLFGAKVCIRSVGATAYRYVFLEGSPPVARTGETRLQKIKPSNKDLHWHDRPDEHLSRSLRTLQTYAYRVLEEIDPLPTRGTEDEGRFAHAESVQVDAREEKGGQLIVLTGFQDTHRVTFDEEDAWLLGRFVEEVLPGAELLLWRGKSEAREHREFWQSSKFKKPSSKLRKRLRALFPEDL